MSFIVRTRQSFTLSVLRLLKMLVSAFLVVWAVAFGTEDVVVPIEDNEKRQKTVYVTGQRTTGSATSLVMFIRNGGTMSDFLALGLRGDGAVLAQACSRNPDSFACEHLHCEVNPNDPECQSVQDTVVVTSERSTTSTYRWLYNFIKTSHGTLLLDLKLVPPDSNKAKQLTEQEICDLLEKAKDDLLQEAYEQLDWIKDQYYFTYGSPAHYYWPYEYYFNLPMLNVVKFDPNKLARLILEHGKKLLVEGYAKDGTVMPKIDYWQEVGFYVYWNKRTGQFRTGKYSYGPISESTERMYPAYDPVTLKHGLRAGSVQINWTNDNLANDEELIARVHVHPKTYYREALYPSLSDIVGIDYIRKNKNVHNREWKHVQDFILFPPTKNYELAKKYDGKTDSKITMLVHDSKWSLAQANKEWSKRKESLVKRKSVYDNFDKYTYRLDETGKVVEGKINFDGVDLDDQIEKNCQ